jgi:hypothetical protein
MARVAVIESDTATPYSLRAIKDMERWLIMVGFYYARFQLDFAEVI